MIRPGEISSTLNRLWVRFALGITGLVFVVTVLPAASLLLTDTHEVIEDWHEYIESLDGEAALGLNPSQINYLAEVLADVTQQTYAADVQYLTLTTIIVGLLAGALLGRGLSRPIERLASAVRAVGSHQLSHRVEVRGAQEIKDLAESFNQMTAELARSEQLRHNMMADISHELLTPLTVLQGNLRAILDDVYELNKDEIGTLYEQNKHLVRLVRDLRQLAQVETGQMQFQVAAVEIEAILLETVTFFDPVAAEKTIAIQSAFANNLPPLQVDPDRLRQVLHNLMANALRHTPEGGQITIRTALATGGVRLSISDTGEGIDPDKQSHVFDRFYRSEEGRRRDSGGAGLGLAISKAIVQAQGGHIAVASLGKNKGSEFAIWMPLENLDSQKPRN